MTASLNIGLRPGLLLQQISRILDGFEQALPVGKRSCSFPSSTLAGSLDLLVLDVEPST